MNELLNLNVTGLSTQGLGIARRPDGKVLMVKNALPGENVKARLIDERKSFALAQAEQILQVSPQRIQPPCPWFGQCGGCDLQHLAYPAQLQVKLLWLKQSLRALQPLPEIALYPSPLPLGYRHRLRLHCQQGLGFFARQSHKLVQVDDCLLATGLARRHWSALSQLSALPGLREVEILAGAEQIYASLLGPALKRRRLEVAGLDLHWPDQPPEFSAGIIYYERNGIKLKVWPGQFSQVNWEVNHKLITCLLDFAWPYSNNLVYDLFAGSGNLSLPLAQAGAEVWAVESNPLACAAGSYQATAHNLACRFIHAPVQHFLSQATRRPGLLVVDPPRSGLGQLLAGIVNLKAQAICYVSCHPAAMARDLKALGLAGYHLEKLALLDMFPQTGQMECLSFLVK